MSNLLLQKIVPLRVAEVEKMILKKKRPLLLARSVVGSSAALMGRLDTELALKSILVLPLTYTGIAAQCWKAVSSKKLSPSTATEMHFLSCSGCFSRGLLRW